MADACPGCGSDDIFGKKFGFGDVTVYEFYCKKCELFEDRRSTDPDFAEWWARWRPDADDDESAAESASGDESDEPPRARDLVEPPRGPPIAANRDARFGPAKAREELYDRICRDVSDDSIRLAYADSIASKRPERAEFIRLQVERARNERASRALRSAPSAREAELRQRFGVEWAHAIEPFARPLAPNAPDRGWEYERGFIAEMRTDPDMVADSRDFLFRSTPIEHIDLTSDGPILAALAAPRAAQVRSFALRELGLGDEDMVALARDARLDGCEWLDLRSNNIGERGVTALAESARIRAIPIVLLRFNPCDPGTQYSDDGSGYGEMWLPPEGKALEKLHGRIPWLHLPPSRRMPDRYHARAVQYVDDE
jgi:uncharacterized protein (TIGR02996 family)